MSLLQQILSQPSVMIIIMLIGALIFIAFGVMVFAQLRQIQERRARRRERRMQMIQSRSVQLLASEIISEEEVSPLAAPKAVAEVQPETPVNIDPEPISSLLTNVFTEEEVSNKHEVLLSIVTTVDIHQLTALGKQVAQQLALIKKG